MPQIRRIDLMHANGQRLGSRNRELSGFGVKTGDAAEMSAEKGLAMS